MADRTVKVTLSAEIAGYLQGMDRAQRKTHEAGSEIEKLAQKRQAFQTLGVSALALGTAIVAGIGMAVAKYAEFDQAMSNANAILQETTDNQYLLRDAALDAGAVTVFTATESANAIEELGKAGISTADILGGALPGSLDLAAAAQLGVARAAEITGITLKQFNLDGTNAARVADVLAAGANKAVGSVDDLANGLKFVGPVAAGMNVSLEDTVATLALFADRGVIGEQAGTSLRGMLSSLTSPSSMAAKELEKLNVSLYDGQGRFKGLENVAGELNRALAHVSDAQRDVALGAIFGNQQLTAARILVDSGAEGWREYREAVEDSGIAARVAQDRMDNLAGDIEKLGGALDTALIQTGSAANDVLRHIVQNATALVDFVGELPEPAIDAGVAIGTVAGSTALAGGAALVAIPRIAELRSALGALEISGRAAAGGVGVAGAALAAVVMLMDYIATEEAKRKNSIESFARSLDQATGATTAYTRELIAQRLAEEGAVEIGERLGLTIGELVDLTMSGKDAIGEWADAQRTANADNAATVAQYDTVSSAIEVVGRQLDRGREQWRLTQEATRAAREATSEQERALASLSGVAADAHSEVEGLSDSIRNFGKLTLDTRDAARQFEAAVDDLAGAIKENGTTLDRDTEKGRKNEAALDALTKKTFEYAAAVYDETRSMDEATAVMERGREELIKQLEAFGITGQAAQDYADELGLIPRNIDTYVNIKTDQARKDLDALIRGYQNKEISMSVALKNGATRADLDPSANASGGFYSGKVKQFASGGFEPGIYGYTPGGIHKFAEAGDEAYLSFLDQYRERNIAVWEMAGERLGVWRTAGAGAAGAGADSAPIQVLIQSKGGVDLLEYIDVQVEAGARTVLTQEVAAARTAVLGR